ncbi:MAG: hypothetical protein EA361_17940 [Bacteroidetes bacterium]|nr:MAG: hypothetical protein EA361_17940 [Bacteroidota bacterium]
MIFRLLFLFFLALASCVKPYSGPIEAEDLILLATYDLDIVGPSGLSRSNVPDHFYTVSDNSGNIYLINKEGEILLTLPINGDDLEGIEFVEETLSLYVLEEQLRQVLRVTLGGQVTDTFQLDIPIQNLNDGPEGIAYNPNKEHFYIVNEKNPAMLYVYDTSFQLLEEHPLKFAKDYSSADYDPIHNHLWILSEESKVLARCNLQGKPEKVYNTGVPDGEGVVVDVENGFIYIVCDDTSRLFIFQLPE